MKIKDNTFLKKKASQLEEEGFVAFNNFDLRKALTFYKKAKKYNIHAGNIKGASWDEFTIGNILSVLQTDPDSIIFHYKQALKFFQMCNDPLGEKRTLRKLSQVFLNAQRFLEAEKYAEKLYFLAKKGDDKSLYIESLLMLWWSKKNIGRASEDIQELITDAIGSKFLKIDIKAHQDITILTKGFEELPENFEEQLKIEGNTFTLGFYYQEKASHLLERLETENAIDFFKKAQDIAIEIKNLILYFLSNIGLILSYDLKGDYMNAIETLLVGAASIRNVLGEVVTPYFYMIYQGLEEKWGKEVFGKTVVEFQKKINNLGE